MTWSRVHAPGELSALGWETEIRDGTGVSVSPCGDVEVLQRVAHIANVRVRVGSKWTSWVEMGPVAAVMAAQAHATHAQGRLRFGEVPQQ